VTLYVGSPASGSFVFDTLSTTATVSLGTWTQVAATFTGGVMKIYINGVQAATKTSTKVTATQLTHYTNEDLYLGSLWNKDYRLDGALDEARVYNRALSLAEVRQLAGALPSPQFSLASGTYTGAQSVTLSSSTSGASIRYTTDGVTTPTETVGTVYTTPITVSTSQTIKAVAYKSGSMTSDVSTASYAIVNAPATGLALYLAMDGNTNDTSGNGNNGVGTTITPTLDRLGVSNRAYAFNATTAAGSSIKVAEAASLDTDTAFTLSTWVKVNSYPATKGSALFSKWWLGTSGGDYLLTVNPTGTVTLYVGSPASGSFVFDTLSTTATVSLGTWTQVAATFNSGVMTIYINGVQAATKTSTKVTATQLTHYTNEDLYLGSLWNKDYRLDGALDEARVYNRALNATEMTQLYGAVHLASAPTVAAGSKSRGVRAAAASTARAGMGGLGNEVLSSVSAADKQNGAEPVPGEIFTDRATGSDFVWVPAGTFVMGDDREGPAHPVTLTQGYWLGMHEVTQAQWQAVMGDNPSHFQGCPQCPVEQVSWNDVEQFIAKLNAQTGETYQLPTEAQWEYAARSGGLAEAYSGTNALSQVLDYAWVKDNSAGHTQPVGVMNPNGLGLCDMSGNVLEWVQDAYGPYSAAAETDPTGVAQGPGRVIRGGGWNQDIAGAQTTIRGFELPQMNGPDLGFRLVRVAR
jgi:formylglycine-generating enzyme required for sulfatase activity